MPRLLAGVVVPDAEVPIRMVLHCPVCHLQHIDEVDEARNPGWTNPPHRSHKCMGCNTIWRPCDVATEGVRSASTRGKADTWPTDIERFSDGRPKPYLSPEQYDQLRDDDRFLYNRGVD